MTMVSHVALRIHEGDNNELLRMLLAPDRVRKPESVVGEFPTVESRPDKQLDVEKYPLLLSSLEQDGMNFPHVLSVIKCRVKAPSEMAQLDRANLPPLIQQIDDAFERAMRGYRDTLLFALRNDIEKIDDLDEKLEQALNNANYTRKYTLLGLLFLGFGAIPGFFIGKARDDDRKESNAMKTHETRYAQSTQRRDWLKIVDSKEKDRLNDMQIFLEIRMKVLVSSLQESLKSQEWNIANVYELKCCYRVFISVFPEKPLEPIKLDTKAIQLDEFLKQFEGKK